MASSVRRSVTITSLSRHFRETPHRHLKTLLVSSADVDEDGDRLALSSHRAEVRRRVEAVRFELGARHGVPLVSCTAHSTFCDGDEVERAIDLARRSGATGRVVGAGSRAAIDLARIVAALVGATETVVVPVTAGAVAASAGTWALTFSEEEGILRGASVADAIVARDDAAAAAFNGPASVRDAAHAALTLLTDASVLSNDDDAASIVVGVAGALREGRDDDGALTEVLARAGESSPRGRRGAPLALACGLLPPFFPHVNLLTFLASLLPAVCEVRASNAMAREVSELLTTTGGPSPPSLAAMVRGTTHPDVATMIDRVEDNLASPLWNSGEYRAAWEDEERGVLEEILHRSLNR